MNEASYRAFKKLCYVYELGENWVRHTKQGAILLLLPVIRVKVKKRALLIRQNNSPQHVSLLTGFCNTFVIRKCQLFKRTELIA